jgi:hypothetical protein
MMIIGLLRNFPIIFRTTRFLFKKLLEFSYWIYKPIIHFSDHQLHQFAIAPKIRSALVIALCACISVIFALLFYLVVGWRISLFAICLPCLHGSLVGFLWKELEGSNKFRTGEAIE